jgi:hypothetical protein
MPDKVEKVPSSPRLEGDARRGFASRSTLAGDRSRVSRMVLSVSRASDQLTVIVETVQVLNTRHTHTHSLAQFSHSLYHTVSLSQPAPALSLQSSSEQLTARELAAQHRPDSAPTNASSGKSREAQSTISEHRVRGSCKVPRVS